MRRPASLEPFRRVMVGVEHSPATARILGRVARLPLAADARVTLVHVVPKELPATVVARAETEALRALRTAVRRLTRTLPKGVVVESAVRVGRPAAALAEHAGRTGADLVVVGRGAWRWHEELLGSTAARVVRHAKVPVLTVRRPALAPYRRPLLALDQDDAAAGVVAAALRIVGVPRPAFAIVHAYDPPFRGLFCSSPAQARELHRYHRAQAERAIGRLTAAVPEPGLVWQPRVVAGSARRAVPKTAERLRADLLVLGTRGHAGVAYAFLGTVAGDVLRDVACDVLVVPPRRGAAGA